MNQRHINMLTWMRSGRRMCNIKLYKNRTVITGFQFQRLDGTTVYGTGYKTWIGGEPYAPRSHATNGEISFELAEVAQLRPMI